MEWLSSLSFQFHCFVDHFLETIAFPLQSVQRDRWFSIGLCFLSGLSPEAASKRWQHEFNSNRLRKEQHQSNDLQGNCTGLVYRLQVLCHGANCEHNGCTTVCLMFFWLRGVDPEQPVHIDLVAAIRHCQFLLVLF